MNLDSAVQVYLSRMQSLGYTYDNIREILLAFSRHVGHRSLRAVTVRDVTQYLGRTRSDTSNRRLKYDHIARFFRYFVVAGNLRSAPLPNPPRLPKKTFSPYIYSRSEIRHLTKIGVLLRAVSNPNGLNVLSADTLRALFLFLYGTGVTVSEALNLTWQDVDLRKRTISVRIKVGRVARTIPVSRDIGTLLAALRKRSRFRPSGHCFQTKDERRIPDSTLICTFRRVRDFCGIVREGRRNQQPRMHDLRMTFAVHRIAAWYAKGKNAEHRVSALGAYMGFKTLAAMRYLLLVPEHYKRNVRVRL